MLRPSARRITIAQNFSYTIRASICSNVSKSSVRVISIARVCVQSPPLTPAACIMLLAACSPTENAAYVPSYEDIIHVRARTSGYVRRRGVGCGMLQIAHCTRVVVTCAIDRLVCGVVCLNRAVSKKLRLKLRAINFDYWMSADKRTNERYSFTDRQHKGLNQSLTALHRLHCTALHCWCCVVL